jgi:hypothetical protein
MKIIKTRATNGQFEWILIPDIHLANITRRRAPISFLDVFYSFAPQLVKSERKKWVEGVKCTMIDLNNRVTGMNYICKEIKKHESRLLCLKKDQKNISDYKPYQIFLVFVEAYLNCLHSIRDLIKNIDDHLDQTYYKSLMQEGWFKFEMDLRTLCHHIETPIITVERNVIILRFERSEKIQTIRFISDSMKDEHGIITIELNCADLGMDMNRFLNQWAKQHLDHINTEEIRDQIITVKEDGTYKTRKITLGKLLIIADSNARL